MARARETLHISRALLHGLDYLASLRRSPPQFQLRVPELHPGNSTGDWGEMPTCFLLRADLRAASCHKPTRSVLALDAPMLSATVPTTGEFNRKAQLVASTDSQPRVRRSTQKKERRQALSQNPQSPSNEAHNRLGACSNFEITCSLTLSPALWSAYVTDWTKSVKREANGSTGSDKRRTYKHCWRAASLGEYDKSR